MSGSLLSFCLMAIGARELAGDIPVFQTLFVRSAVGLLCVVAILYVTKQAALIKTKALGLHVFRNSFHLSGQYGWFLGIGLLPLAEVFALEFTVPIWTAIFASIALKETLTRRKLIAIACGLLGVLVIVQPGVAIVNVASLIVLGAAICYAIAHTSTKALSATEKPIVILFYMCLVQLPVALALSLSAWVWPVGVQWVWLVSIALSALSAHYCMVKAMHYAEITIIVTMDFLRLPLIAMLGMLLYQEHFEFAIMLGGALMLLGNLVNAWGAPASTREQAGTREALKPRR
jgi:drug/metabolite transporter (DMT)-like permease